MTWRTQPLGLRMKQELQAFAQTFIGVAVLSAVVLGIGGSIYLAIAPGGLLARAFGRGLTEGTALMVALFAIAFLAWITRGHALVLHRHRVADTIVYSFAALGALYAATIAIRGSLL